ncbi:MAG TPA: nicotinate-nucleotide--dimethylbenzimidazole phosphoribosyltransferase [Actinomycetota bacterium]|nr:nicotinate-nucleotide--dimethylbenzimidazole phosphoribosyltransferase [Actinomycetota bacterium]
MPESQVHVLARRVVAPDGVAAEAARARQDQLVKPQGSLGRVEGLGVQLSAIAHLSPPPVPQRPAVLIAAGDHGVLAHGVSPWPPEVTAAMIASFCAGTAAVNAIADVVGAAVTVLDVGVASELPNHPRLRRARVRSGTDDLLYGPAMSRDEAARAVLAGAAAADELLFAGADLLVTGDMGIGNTTAAACLIAAFTGADAAQVTGRGTGIDDATLELKTKVVHEALQRHQPDLADPIGVLAALGGLEHAALVGLILAGAAHRVPIVLDGVSAAAAALAGAALAPLTVGYLIAGHRSVEPGATIALAHLALEPVIDLGLRLGEGTGGLLAVPVVTSAAATLSRMATFAEAGIG